jgi:hypothetical protein
VAVSATADPVAAPRTPPPNSTESIKPPGSLLSRRNKASKRRLLAPLSLNRQPISIKSGIQVKIKEYEVPHREGPIPARLGTPRKNAIESAATNPIARATIEPLKIPAIKITAITPKVTIGLICASSP